MLEELAEHIPLSVQVEWFSCRDSEERQLHCHLEKLAMRIALGAEGRVVEIRDIVHHEARPFFSLLIEFEYVIHPSPEMQDRLMK